MSSVFIFSVAFALAVTIVLNNALDDGRYRPYRPRVAATTKPNYQLDGRYTPKINDGRYYPSNEGKYRGLDDGKYRPSKDGKYKGDNGRYKHRNKDSREFAANDGKYVANKTQFRDTTNKKNKLADSEQPKLSARNGSSIGKNSWRILHLFDKEERDGYHYIYETENGINAEEEGHIVKLPTGKGLRSTGFFEYTGDDGQLYRVDYVADDKGFVPRGAHIPQTPRHVIKLLDFLALKMKQ